METLTTDNTRCNQTKICRLCGHYDKENVDIFDIHTPWNKNSDDLSKKILIVYPLVLYKGDPLPQHICPKCINNVNASYRNIQQVLMQQNKWLSSIKATQPGHKYCRIFNAVENARKSTQELKISLCTELNDDGRKKFIELRSKVKQDPNSNLKRLLASSAQDMCNPLNKVPNKLALDENVVKNIQTKLESNGFTIKRIKVKPIETTNLHLKTSTANLVDTQTTISTSGDTTVTCKYCNMHFSSLKILALHQIVHLKIRTHKIFQKRVLAKNLRRGRLITINNSKSIRCLNCWRIYADNKAILQHWSCGECDFFCSICGKEFPHSPKMLREHVPAEHDISYRSLMCKTLTKNSERIKPLNMSTQLPSKKQPTTIKVNKYKKDPKTCIINDDGTITCKICRQVFDNFRSSNSHMRKHKPTIQYGDTNYAASTRIDTYNTQDEDSTMQPTTSQQSNQHTSSTAAVEKSTTNMLTKSPRPKYRVLAKNGPLLGIRTKIVEKRQDFMANNKHINFIGIAGMESLNNKTISMPETNIDNMIVPEIIPVIKSEPLMENEIHYNDGNVNMAFNSTCIKSEPLDDNAHVQSKNAFLCFICYESFPTNNDLQMHTIYAHNIH